MCDKTIYSLLKIFNIPYHQLRFGTLKEEGGQGDGGGWGIVRTSGKILSPWNGYRNTTFYRQETRTQLHKLRSQLRESFLI